MAEIWGYWPLVAASVAFRLALLFCFTDRLNLGSRPEVATPLTSLRRRRASLAAFGWVMATHLSLYPAILIVPVILLLGSGLDTPPPKLFVLKNSSAAEKSPSNHGREHKVTSQTGAVQLFSWRPVVSFVLWASIWSCYVLFLSTISLKGYDGLFEMFRK